MPVAPTPSSSSPGTAAASPDTAWSAGRPHRDLPARGALVVPPGTTPADGPIVFIGTAEPRKNIAGLLSAYETSSETLPDAPPLLLAGRPPARAIARFDGLLESPARKGQARHLGYISDPDCRDLYERASMVVVPSLDEGFGMTALEAMTVGVPVVASNRGALPEVVADAGLLVDPEATRLTRPGDGPHAERPKPW